MRLIAKRAIGVVVALTFLNTFANLIAPPPHGPGWLLGEVVLLACAAGVAACVWAFDDLI